MTEPVKIGLQQVYDAVTALGGKLDKFVLDASIEAALLKQRVDALEKRQEGEQARRWQLYVALLGAGVAIAIAIIK